MHMVSVSKTKTFSYYNPNLMEIRAWFHNHHKKCDQLVYLASSLVKVGDFVFVTLVTYSLVFLILKNFIRKVTKSTYHFTTLYQKHFFQELSLDELNKGLQIHGINILSVTRSKSCQRSPNHKFFRGDTRFATAQWTCHSYGTANRYRSVLIEYRRMFKWLIFMSVTCS